MGILEFIISTLFFEKLRPYFTRKPKNNLKAIAKMSENGGCTTFATVGELKKLLTNFADDTEMRGSSFQYPHLQMYELNNKGLIFLGSSNQLSKKE